MACFVRKREDEGGNVFRAGHDYTSWTLAKLVYIIFPQPLIIGCTKFPNLHTMPTPCFSRQAEWVANRGYADSTRSRTPQASLARELRVPVLVWHTCNVSHLSAGKSSESQLGNAMPANLCLFLQISFAVGLPLATFGNARRSLTACVSATPNRSERTVVWLNLHANAPCDRCCTLRGRGQASIPPWICRTPLALASAVLLGAWTDTF
ncbi:predicted protein [Plenodomus lingam JN3]|uniref:Predicted protein n=1 Tax=Leptosphaeria maculans (strain JN3 / isolate v23.1.3 / race Av1-4-5-6-7-8) TaxID=985895 RepID=E5A3L2_LEPMJ|nr:predicted protein [Plenodomus lingam JN3]CBX98225.1 predicted protein [Plenodomus lingam JN3]